MQIQSQPEWMTPRPQSVFGTPTQLPGYQTGFGQSADTSAVLPRPNLATKLAQPEPKNKPAEPHKKNQEHGNASRWVTAYKLGFSLFVAGAANAFLFGVPLWWAAGLSAIVAGTQSAIALKVHKEDTDFSKKLVGTTRKLMRREKDQTPAGKEWSMVPVWGMVCGLIALVEAGCNHIYSLKYPNVDPVAQLKKRTQVIQAGIDKKGLLKPLYELQMTGMKRTQEAKLWLAEKLPERLTPRLKQMYNRLWKLLENNVKGNPKVGYLVAFTLAGIGGIAQTSIAAAIQGRIDNNQATNPKALLGAIKGATPLKKIGQKSQNNPEKKPPLEPSKTPDPKQPLAENAKPPLPADDKAKKDADEARKKVTEPDPKLPVPVKPATGKEDAPPQGTKPEQSVSTQNPFQKVVPENK